MATVERVDVAQSIEDAVSAFGAAIAEPARLRILFCLMDGNARTSTELAIVANLSSSGASMHLARLKKQHLVAMLKQGKHHYYQLEGNAVAAALEALTFFAGGTPETFLPDAPSRVRTARTCYDHIAGQLAVALHDQILKLAWLVASESEGNAYELTEEGEKAFGRLGVNIDDIRVQRRRFACACVDWSERRPHIGGALGSALLKIALKRSWVIQDLDGRALTVTGRGRREMHERFGVLV